jgi:DTW domain-containing protein YfiP
MKKFKGKSTKKELCKKCGLPTKMCICKEVETSVNAHKSKVMDDLKKKAIEKSRK